MTDAHTRTDADRPLVTAVVIFYQAERFLEEALESIAAQTSTDWEAVLVDDGSTDRSAEIAEAFVARNPERARLVRHPGGENRGMSASRNLGIAHARGDLIAFLDADDVWLPFKLEMQAGLLARSPGTGLVYGPTEYWFSWTGAEDDLARDFVGELRVAPGRVIEPPELLALALETHGGMLPGICSLMVRRKAVEEVGGFEVSFRGSYEDQVFLTKLFRTARALVTDRCSDRYRQHDDSCCAVALRSGEYHPDRPHPARERYLEWLDRFLSEHPVPPGDPWGPRIERALAREWEPYRSPLRHRVRSAAGALAGLPRRAARLAARQARKRLPPGVRAALRARLREGRWVPPRGWVRLGSLRRPIPISRDYGYDRGTPVDRHLVEAFLARHAADVRGRVLEVGDSTYTRRFGRDRVTRADVLNVAPGDPETTFVADLANAPQLEDGAYDCVILTQTLQLVYDLRAAVRTLERILAPGGVVLATAPGLTQIVPCPWEDSWYWSLTRASARALFLERFREEDLTIDSPGNVLSATAFLQGLAAEELRPAALERDDPDYQLLVTIRAVKSAATQPRGMAGRWSYAGRAQDSYGDDTTYRIGMEFLDAPGATIEDWGCGLAYAKRFVERGRYVGVDGSPSQWTDRVADLTEHRSDVECVFMRHVLEHNPDWQYVLDGALASFRERMALILFTPFVAETRALNFDDGIPDLAFRREDITERFPDDVRVTERAVETDTQYGVEHVFLLERVPAAETGA